MRELRHIRILSIYVKEAIFSVHWSASRVTNLIIQPWLTLSTYKNKRRHCLKDEEEENSELLDGIDKTGFNNDLLKVRINSGS